MTRAQIFSGERRIYLDDATAALLREHRKAQIRQRMSAASWTDADLMFCQGDGTPYKPDYVTRRFKRLAKLAGLPVIRLHEGRHTAASLAYEAEVDPATSTRR